MKTYTSKLFIVERTSNLEGHYSKIQIVYIKQKFN